MLTVAKHAYLNTIIQSALAVGKTPTAMFFDDPSRSEWTPQDFKLVKAYYLKETYDRDGYPIWFTESSRITWEVQSKTDRRRAAIERAQKRKGNKEPPPGQYWIANPVINDGGTSPTKQEWLEELADLNKGNRRQW